MKFTFAISNAASGLDLAAQMCLFEKGDEVIIPAHTYTASAYPFIKHGAKISWADIDLETRVVNLESVMAAYSNKTKAIVIVHLYGFGVDIEPIINFAKERNLLVIEDVAQAMGVQIGSKFAGSFGDISVFSFHSHKNITTLGEGGMICCNDKRYGEILPMLRHNGHSSYAEERENYWLPAMGNLELPVLDGRALFPSNYCLGEVECAIGAKLIDRVDSINTEKRSKAINFIDELNKYEELNFHRVETNRHNYHLLAARVIGINRNNLIKKLSVDYGIQCATQYMPLYRYPFYKSLGYGESQAINSNKFYDQMISFPFHSAIAESDIHYIIESVKSVLDNE